MINLNYIHIDNRHKVKALVDIIRVHSKETYQHSKNVAEISLAIGQALKLPQEQLTQLYTAGLLHDIGKLSIRKEILHKKDCSEEEIEYIREQHILGTKSILTGYLDKPIVDMCCHHHERLNGTGYPLGLDRTQLSLGDRILHIADIVSAMSLRRSYIALPYTEEEVKQTLSNLAAKGELDENLVDFVVNNMHYIKQEPFRAFDYPTSLAILKKASALPQVASERPTMYVFAGPNASGKSTLIANRYVRGELNAPYINADIITKYELEDITDETERARTGMFMAMGRVKDAIEKGVSFTYETVLSHPSKIDLIRLAKENGYNIQSVFVCTEDPEINIARLQERVQAGGHDVPRDKVYHRFERAISLSLALQTLSDSYENFDNTQTRPVVSLSEELADISSQAPKTAVTTQETTEPKEEVPVSAPKGNPQDPPPAQ